MPTMNEALEIEIGLLAAPILQERPWAVFASCKESDADLFFPASKKEERAALAVCTVCPVIDDCLEYALESKERFGVWGGTTEKERRRLLRRMGRGDATAGHI